jgi:hypothetical protein
MLHGEFERVVEREDPCVREGVDEQEPWAVEEIPNAHTVSTPHMDSESWIRDSFTCDPSIDHVTYPELGFTWDY